MYVASIILVAFGSSVSNDFPFLTALVLVTVTLFALARLWYAKNFEQRYQRLQETAVREFSLLLVIQCSIFSWAAFSVIIHYGQSVQSIMALLFGAAAVAAGTSSLAPRASVHRIFTATIMAPLAMALIPGLGQSGIALLIGTFLLGLFYLREGQMASQAYRDLIYAQFDLEDAAQQLKQLNQAKNQLLGTAAHDIRGPIGAIKTAASQIIKRAPAPARTQELLEMIETSSTDLIDLLDELLDASSIESGEIQLKRSSCDIARLLADRIRLYKAEAETKNIDLTLTLRCKKVLNVDVVKIRQVVDNLITNGIKYTPIDGQVALCLDASKEASLISISDSGSGVQKTEQVDLYKPFTTLSSKTTAGEKATGLGLAIAARIVEAHGGSIHYSDAELGGACFTIRLPTT